MEGEVLEPPSGMPRVTPHREMSGPYKVEVGFIQDPDQVYPGDRITEYPKRGGLLASRSCPNKCVVCEDLAHLRFWADHFDEMTVGSGSGGRTPFAKPRSRNPPPTGVSFSSCSCWPQRGCARQGFAGALHNGKGAGSSRVEPGMTGCLSSGVPGQAWDDGWGGGSPLSPTLPPS